VEQGFPTVRNSQGLSVQPDGSLAAGSGVRRAGLHPERRAAKGLASGESGVVLRLENPVDQISISEPFSRHIDWRLHALSGAPDKVMSGSAAC
jgi:hypothetical protein